MVPRYRIIETARSYLGTPFHHQGRVKGVGVDCVGLLVGVGRELGLQVHDYKGYSRRPDGVTLKRELAKSLDVVEGGANAEAVLGDVLVFWILRPDLPTHAAILTDKGMIHTYADVGKVVEHWMDGTWRERLDSVYRFRNVEPIFTGFPLPIENTFSVEREVRRTKQGGCCGQGVE